jgi:hypothetical protein
LKSTIPVCGECSAAIPRACGSISSIPLASILRTSLTPFALARRSSSSRRASSEESVATISLPQRSVAMPWASQYSYISLAPSTHSRALSEPGA